jgi:creatinine amidohydrolase/Fe(II)-dependent formamide hydrolase-like protein
MPVRLVIVLCAICALLVSAESQVLRIAELNTEQIKRLDRAKAVVIIPGGILEEHGPYLPAGTDTFFNERLSERLAEAIAARKGWSALMFPVIYLGSGGAEGIGYRVAYPGSYTIRAETLRNVYMDLGDRLGRDGFKHIFVVHNHGAPFHHRAIVTAGEYFHDTYGGDMVHLLTFLHSCCRRPAEFLAPEQLREAGFSVHASTGEHSSVLFLRPDLVPDSIRTATSITGRDFADLVQIARQPEWPGYFGAPKYASAAQGADEFRAFTEAAAALALKIIDGFDYRTLKQYADLVTSDPAVAAVVSNSLAEEDRLKKQQEAWLQKHDRSSSQKR